MSKDIFDVDEAKVDEVIKGVMEVKERSGLADIAFGGIILGITVGYAMEGGLKKGELIAWVAKTWDSQKKKVVANDV